MRQKLKTSEMIPAAKVRESFGDLLEEVSKNNKTYIVQKRGEPRAIVLSIGDYIRLAAPEPEVLKLISQNSKKRGTDRFTSKEIDSVIKEVRKSNASISTRT